MRLTKQDKHAIEAALQKCFWVDTDKHGSKFIEIYADYRDTNDFLLQTAYDHRKDAFGAKNGYDPENGLLFALQDKITETYDDVIWEYESEVLREANVDSVDYEEQLEYLRELAYFVPPYDHFLNQDMNVNILIGTPEEQNHDFGTIHYQYLAMSDPDELWNPEESMQESSGISWLLEQQGYSMDELCETMKDYNEFFYGGDIQDIAKGSGGKALSFDDRLSIFNESHSKFLASVCQELDNHSYSMGALTVLSSMSMKDFSEMMQQNKEITFPKDTMIGIFNPWNGSGSLLEIELDKPLTVPSSLIFDVQIEGVNPQYTYTVDDVYGLVGSAWKEPIAINPTKSVCSKAVV